MRPSLLIVIRRTLTEKNGTHQVKAILLKYFKTIEELTIKERDLTRITETLKEISKGLLATTTKEDNKTIEIIDSILILVFPMSYCDEVITINC
jgi:hypothetical protein